MCSLPVEGVNDESQSDCTDLKKRGINIITRLYAVVCRTCWYRLDILKIVQADQMRVAHIRASICPASAVKLWGTDMIHNLPPEPDTCRCV